MIDFRRIALTELDFNTGQIPGLPANPREWADTELKRLAIIERLNKAARPQR